MLRSRYFLSTLAVLALFAGSIQATAAKKSKLLSSLSKGTVKLQSAGPLAFGPEGILFIGDPMGAAIYAVDTDDRVAPSSTARPMVKKVDAKIASMLGTDSKQIRIRDLAVNPISGNTYVSVARGRGPSAMPVMLKVNREGKISEFSLKSVPNAKAEIPNAVSPTKRGRRGPLRALTITDMAYVKGRLVVAGLSNEEWASTLRSIPFPFTKVNKGTGVQIFHGAHGRYETRSPVRTFVPYTIGKEAHLVAAYTCTPLVKFPVKELKPGAQVKGTTVAELGNRNSPLDMIAYKRGGKDYLLIANSSRGVMKLPVQGIDKVSAITAKVPRGDKAGLKYETISDLKGVVQLDRFDRDHAVVLLQTDDGTHNLKTIELP